MNRASGFRQRPRVLHVITGLDTGGAETSLLRLIATTRETVEHHVCSLTSLGTLGAAIEAEGATVRALAWRRSIPGPRAPSLLLRHVRAVAPDVLHGWMYHGNLAATLSAAACAHRPTIVWSVRHALDAWAHESDRLRRTIRLSALVSRSADHIVYNSERAAGQHAGIGFARQHAQVIPNGFALDVFRPDATARARVRALLNVRESTPLIGLIARVDPLKDHTTFVAAAARLAARDADVCFLLAGRGTDAPGTPLAQAIASANLSERFRCLGERGDVARLFAALDVATLTSLSEGFPNAIGEAMACGVPCVATNVGDAAALIGDTGALAAPGDAVGIANAWESVLALSAAQRLTMGIAARARIAQRYSLAAVAAQYVGLYQPLPLQAAA